MSEAKRVDKDSLTPAETSTERVEQMIQRTLELDKDATPKPWETHNSDDNTGYPCYFIHGFSGDAKRDFVMHKNNAQLIGEYRTLAPALAIELRATRERLQAATAYVESRCYEEVEHLDGYVTRDMATDAGEPGMEGMPVYSNRVEEHPEWLALLAILKGEQ